MKSFFTFLESYRSFKKTWHRPMSPPKPQTYSSKPVKLDEPENEPDKAAIENGKKFGIGTPEHIERLRKMLQARDAKEETINENRYVPSKEGMMKGYWKVVDTHTGQVHKSGLGSKAGAQSEADALNRNGAHKLVGIPHKQYKVKEETINEKILTSSRNLIGKRVTINNPKVASWHGRTGRVEKVFNNGYIGIKFRNVDHVVELHPSDIGKIRPGI